MTSLHFEPPVVAHRGACGYAPENTMSAFIKALQLGIKWVEFDVMQSACNEVVIFHDESLERLTNVNGDLAQYPYHYLLTLDVGSKFSPFFSGERIPTLKQVCHFLIENKLNANIELKPNKDNIEALITKVLEIVFSFPSDKLPQILFSSFSIEALQMLRKHSKDCYIGLLLHEWHKDWKRAVDALQCVSVHVNEEVLTKEHAKEIKKANKLLLSYTVNDYARAQELFSWGVDAVFSDVPDKVIKL